MINKTGLNYHISHSDLPEPFDKVPNLESIIQNNKHQYWNILGNPIQPEVISYILTFKDNSEIEINSNQFNSLVEMLYNDVPYEDAILAVRI